MLDGYVDVVLLMLKQSHPLPLNHAITSCSNETRGTAAARNSPPNFVYLLNARCILTCVDRFKNALSPPPTLPEFANIILQRWVGPGAGWTEHMLSAFSVQPVVL